METGGEPGQVLQQHSVIRRTREPGLQVAEEPVLEGMVQAQEEGPGPMEGYDMEENRQNQEEIVKLKQLIQTLRIQQALKWREMEGDKLKNHIAFEKFKKNSILSYDAILEEKQKINDEMVKQQSENDLKVAQLEAELKKVNSELILKSFRFEKEDREETTDECIVSIKCNGNCDPLSCRMVAMKLQGGRRTSPASSAEITATHRCPQCSFSLTRKKWLIVMCRKTMECFQPVRFVTLDSIT